MEGMINVYVLVKTELKYDLIKNETKIFLNAITNSKFKDFLEQIVSELEKDKDYVPYYINYSILEIENYRE